MDPVEDIWIITCYFNPLGFRTRRDNFHHFAGGIAAQGGRLLVVEMAGPDGRFDLDIDQDRYRCVRVKGNGLIWQKERMLNVALSHLPKECTKVVWADGDLVFESDDWIAKTSQALDRHVVVQPFGYCVRLPQGHLRYQGQTQENWESMESFASCYVRDPSLSRCETYRNHGHTGFAWAARRGFLQECGFYDACLTGSGDHLMAHIFAGAISSQCIPEMIGSDHAFSEHFNEWALRANELCQGSLGCVPGTVWHLWHGTLGNRRYRSRNQEFKHFDFQPERDIRIDSNGLWDWSGASTALRRWSEEYFRSRDEDNAEV